MYHVGRRCSIEDRYPLLDELAGGMYTLEMNSFLFPNSTYIVGSSSGGSDCNSGDDGCLEKVIDL